MHKISSPSTPLTLREAILQSKNSLNFIRFILAALVIWGHAYPLTSGVSSRMEFISGMAVNLFFCISGFLILASAQRVGPLSYLWRRFLRIFPGYWVSLLFVVLVAVPISYLMGKSEFIWNTGLNFQYLYKNFDLINLQWSIPGTQEGIPWEAWAGSTWTLQYEFLAYICLMFVAYIPWVKDNQKIVITLLFFLSLLIFPIVSTLGGVPREFNYLARLVPMFLAGSLLYIWGEYVRVYRWLVIASIFVIVISHALDSHFLTQTLQIVFAYGVLGISSIIKIYWGYVNDLSYGVYIYSFPVQQLLILAGSASLGIVFNVFLSLIITMVLAYLSWNYIEKPAMNLKKLVPSHRKMIYSERVS